MKLLTKGKDIIIKKADKGGAIVILDKDDYKAKVMNHLNDQISFEKVETNSLKDLQKDIESFLLTILYSYKIDKNTYDFLLPPANPRTSLFYILPKIHKQNIPGRPIVSSVNSLTENISEFLTYCIQPLRAKLRSHIKDSNDFMKKNVWR